MGETLEFQKPQEIDAAALDEIALGMDEPTAEAASQEYISLDLPEYIQSIMANLELARMLGGTVMVVTDAENPDLCQIAISIYGKFLHFPVTISTAKYYFGHLPVGGDRTASPSLFGHTPSALAALRSISPEKESQTRRELDVHAIGLIKAELAKAMSPTVQIPLTTMTGFDLEQVYRSVQNAASQHIEMAITLVQALEATLEDNGKFSSR